MRVVVRWAGELHPRYKKGGGVTYLLEPQASRLKKEETFLTGGGE